MKYTKRRKEIGERLRSARREAQLSQDEVAAAIEVSQQTVASWEAGRSLPGSEVLLDLCVLYGATPTKLLTGIGCSGTPMWAVPSDSTSSYATMAGLSSDQPPR